MGKRILAQRKGRGSIFEAKTHKCIAPSRLPDIFEPTTATVVEIMHNPGRGTPLAKFVTEDGQVFYLHAVEGLYVGKKVRLYEVDEPSPGDIMKLKDIPPGTLISHVERTPGDGGKFARASGTYAQVIGPSTDGIEVRLPSGKMTILNPECRAVIGVIAGGGRVEKPFLKAGKKYHWMKAKAGKRWPHVRGVAMNPVDHPHGGGRHQHLGYPETVPKSAPPGAKVGSFGARRTGRRKR